MLQRMRIMMKNNKFVRYAASILIIAGLTVTYTVMANPGSEDDPVVSLSYLREIFKPEVKQELVFQVVSVSQGQTIIGGAGSEMILRMGQARVVATNMGGLADVTYGTDLADGSNMPSNHQLIVPKDDGRGAQALTDCLIMVKGDYTIK